MTITPKTTIHTLLKEYPFLLDYLAGYDPEFGKLTNPVLRRTMGRMATLEKAAGMANVPLNQLMNDVAAEIEAKTGANPGVADTAAAGGIDPARLEALKQIITDLHAGHPMDELTQRFGELIEDIEAGEIAAMEQRLIAEGMPESEVKRLCDVHVQVFAGALEGHEALQMPPGHPVDTFQRENQAMLQVVTSLRKVAGAIRAAADPMGPWPALKPALAKTLERLRETELHYVRKENQLFPYLEKHGVEGPSKVMWALHDDIRAALKDARGYVESDDAEQAALSSEWLAQTMEDMVTKEEKILFPMSVEMLTAEEWVEIRAGEDEIGYAFIADVAPWPADGRGAVAPEAGPAASGGPSGLLDLTTGALTREQIDLMLSALPMDISFVDEHDQVRYYSEGERIFPRSPAVIGRKVQNCHPPSSVDKVQEIIDAFRCGEKSTADFWIPFQERFVHIRYFAMRDAAGAYRGTLETVQDVTAIRALEGQRRLVDW
jgi:DUF438 domain-containing protein